MKLLITAIATTIALSSSVYAESAKDDVTRKIRFDLDQLDEYGLYGPEDGRRSLSYEFCIPNDLQAIETVQAIDPTLMIYLQSPGRVGCDNMEVLAIGETHQPHYRDVLINLANLDTIDRIEQFLGE
ncbi:MAG: hypothetical protein F6K00_02005 [Leptolyngbya sp. SIOISBB]|nr:hypothetical protein [Leptolyngbya sp. SIOISBB]